MILLTSLLALIGLFGSLLMYFRIKTQKNYNLDFVAQIQAINKALAVIEFNMDGTIITANTIFLSTMGYSLEEIKGKHHRMFVDSSYNNSIEYRKFWDDLNKGHYSSCEYKRITKTGKEVWLQASYNPIIGSDGKPFKVVKYATDITKQKIQYADFFGQLTAISKSQAIIEFNMDGTILSANQNFLNAMGYALNEIQGQHHQIFVLPDYAKSSDYKRFWEDLNSGEYKTAEFLRIGKNGKEVYIQASYNPIKDINGKPFKVVKYASDITTSVKARLENERGMNESISVLTNIAKGNLTTQMTGEYTNTFSDMRNSINLNIEQLKSMVTKIKGAASKINSDSGNISIATNNLSSRTEEQASSLEETAASMEEMNKGVARNSESLKNANKLSENARNIAEAGGNIVENAVTAMHNIENSSQKIANIISVIDEIAFQTNLLALNASVEAARAGESGKGFAVVAQEVRSLAGRSANASSQIKKLINETVAEIHSGATLVNQTGKSLEDIIASIRQVADIISNITKAVSDQALGINEINTAVSLMDKTTQENAGLVEQNNSAAQSLSDQVNDLNKLMDFFTIEKTINKVLAN